MTMITPASITNANPGPALYAVIETAALALGYTLDDTVVIGGNTHKVLKSAAAGNTYGVDWYLDINYPTTGTTGGIRFAPFEGYNSTTHVATRGPYTGGTSVVDATTYSNYGASTSALETNWYNAAANTTLSTALTTSAFTYWVSITRDRIVVMLSNVSSAIAYAGFFTPSSAHAAYAGAAMRPLIMTVLTVGSNSIAASSFGGSSAALTRAPKVSSITWSSSVMIPAAIANIGALLSGQVGVAASEFTNQSAIVPLPVIMGSVSISSATPLAANVGYLDGVGAGYVASGAVRGDNALDGSTNWYAATPSSSFTLFLKGA